MFNKQKYKLTSNILMMLERKGSIKATIHYSCLYLSELASFQSRGYIHFIILATILIGYVRYKC